MSRKKIPEAELLEAGLDAMLAGEFSMPAVARRAGVTRQSLHNRFGGVADLAVAVAAYVDDKHDIRAQTAPLWAATSGGELLDELAAFHGRYNPLIAPVVLAAHALADRHPEVRAAIADRRAARHAGALAGTQRLVAWGCLREGWTLEAAAQWMVSQGSVPLWHEQVVQLGWSEEVYVERLAKTLRAVLLEPKTS